MILSLLLSLAFSETPQKIDDDGVYYYKEIKKSAEKSESKYGEVIKESSGTYFYKPKKKKDDDIRYGKPTTTKGSISYYDRTESPQDKAATFQIINSRFSNFKSGNNDFKDIYGSAKGFNLDFEWHKNYSLIKLGYIVSSGVLVASGNGNFASGGEAREKYDMFLIPIIAKIRFNFEYSDKQYLVPYIEGGGGLYGISERRDDGKDNTSAYTPVFLAGAGINFLLDWLAPQTIAKVDNSFGVNHMWLNVAYEFLNASNSDFDVGGGQLKFGFKFDY